jgi:hypothetical protein
VNRSAGALVTVGIVAVLTTVGLARSAAAGVRPHRARDAASPAPSAARPTVEGPVTGGKGVPANAATVDLAAAGYEQNEYFISGTATAYTASAPLGSDGKWSATPSGAPAPYKTRILVARPTDP